MREMSVAAAVSGCAGSAHRGLVTFGPRQLAHHGHRGAGRIGVAEFALHDWVGPGLLDQDFDDCLTSTTSFTRWHFFLGHVWCFTSEPERHTFGEASWTAQPSASSRG